VLVSGCSLLGWPRFLHLCVRNVANHRPISASGQLVKVAPSAAIMSVGGALVHATGLRTPNQLDHSPQVASAARVAQVLRKAVSYSANRTAFVARSAALQAPHRSTTGTLTTRTLARPVALYYQSGRDDMRGAHHHRARWLQVRYPPLSQRMSGAKLTRAARVAVGVSYKKNVDHSSGAGAS
jgi:hypothetical protein